MRIQGKVSTQPIDPVTTSEGAPMREARPSERPTLPPSSHTQLSAQSRLLGGLVRLAEQDPGRFREVLSGLSEQLRSFATAAQPVDSFALQLALSLDSAAETGNMQTFRWPAAELDGKRLHPAHPAHAADHVAHREWHGLYDVSGPVRSLLESALGLVSESVRPGPGPALDSTAAPMAAFGTAPARGTLAPPATGGLLPD